MSKIGIELDIELISTYSGSMNTNLPVSPATVAAECFCLTLKRAARAVARRYDEALEPVDLRSGQYSTLMTIAGLQPVTMQVLAETLGMDRTTLTATLKPLQRRRLVTVQLDTSRSTQSNAASHGGGSGATERGGSALEKGAAIGRPYARGIERAGSSRTTFAAWMRCVFFPIYVDINL